MSDDIEIMPDAAKFRLPTVEGLLIDGQRKLVDARALHAAMELPTQFPKWVKYKIDQQSIATRTLESSMNLEPLDFIVVSVRTGNPIAAFLLPSDAVKYIAYRRSIEGPNGPAYDIQNADGSLVSYALDQQVAIANEGPNPYCLVAENAVAAEHFGASRA